MRRFLSRMPPATGFAVARWPVSLTNPIVLCRKAMCDILSSAALSGCEPRGSASDDFRILVLYIDNGQFPKTWPFLTPDSLTPDSLTHDEFPAFSRPNAASNRRSHAPSYSANAKGTHSHSRGQEFGFVRRRHRSRSESLATYHLASYGGPNESWFSRRG